MLDFLPALLVFLLELFLFFAWFKSRRKKDGKERWLCFWGFLVGELYLLWQVKLVGATGKPLPGSPEQNLLMLRVVLGGFFGGVFTLIGLYYLSFGVFRA